MKPTHIYSARITTILLIVLLLSTFAPLHKVNAVPCTFNFSADTTISTTCALTTDTTEGTDKCSVDESNSANTSVLTINNVGITITAGTSGTTILSTGSMVITGASALVTIEDPDAEIRLGSAGGATWVVDADVDGWSTDIDALSTATAAGKRRRCLMRGTAADCSDAAYSETNTCYSYGQSWYYGYGQSWYYGYGQSWYYGYGQSGYSAYHSPYHVFWPGFNPN